MRWACCHGNMIVANGNTHLVRQTLKDDDERSNYDYMLDHPGINYIIMM